MQLPLFKPVDNLEIQIHEKHTDKITVHDETVVDGYT